MPWRRSAATPEHRYEPITAVSTPREQAEPTHASTLIGAWQRFAVGFRALPAGETAAVLLSHPKQDA